MEYNLSIMQQIKELHLDLDGLFADFDGGVQRLTGKLPREIDKRYMWKSINRDKQFFGTLEVIEGSMELWRAVLEVAAEASAAVKFLTGAPAGAHYQQQKREWVAKVFGTQYEVNVVPRAKKQDYSGPLKVLIDDTHGNIHDWIVKGGHGILHQDDFASTIKELRDYHEALRA